MKKVLCEGYKKCSAGAIGVKGSCPHKVPHIHSSTNSDCDIKCCSAFPYSCSEKYNIKEQRKLKLKKIYERV